MSQPNVCSKSYTNANNRHVSIAVASLSPAAAAGGSVEEAAQGSSKVLLLLQRLQAMAPGHKAVVFSQVRFAFLGHAAAVERPGLRAGGAGIPGASAREPAHPRQKMCAQRVCLPHTTQFLGMMDLVAAALKAAAIPFVRLDGRATAAARADMLARFAAPGGPRVFLASLKAGGVGMCVSAWRVAWFADCCCLVCCAGRPARVSFHLSKPAASACPCALGLCYASRDHMHMSAAPFTAICGCPATEMHTAKTNTQHAVHTQTHTTRTGT